VHQRKVETLTCAGHGRAVPSDHDHFIILRDKFVGSKRMVFLSAGQGLEKSRFHLVGSIVLADVGDNGRGVKSPTQLIGKVVDYRFDISFTESCIKLLYQINILLLLHWGVFIGVGYNPRRKVQDR
jgi:hypothetical protein